MIVEWFINAVMVPLTWILGLIPDEFPDMPGGFSMGVPGLEHWEFGHVAWMNDLFPIDTWFLCMAVLVAWALFCHGYRLTLWILGKLHITGSGE